ncbi:30S ribosomal protein S6 [Alterileibacterium massiliense]|uniref:30S ribosomal protein S6 n=1 Tax=Alterileibacterium massiliense TaxID=1870997 RepID=UPI0008D97B91|nr:30S ribosomal protein S6 [Alterileibacterium massiliense]
MKNYEVLFILDPVMDDSEKNAMIERVKEIINDGGEAGEVDIWGNRKLAYEINKKKDGFYVLIQFKANADMPKELDRRLRISDSIMRHIIVCKDEQ